MCYVPSDQKLEANCYLPEIACTGGREKLRPTSRLNCESSDDISGLEEALTCETDRMAHQLNRSSCIRGLCMTGTSLLHNACLACACFELLRAHAEVPSAATRGVFLKRACAPRPRREIKVLTSAAPLARDSERLPPPHDAVPLDSAARSTLCRPQSRVQRPVWCAGAENTVPRICMSLMPRSGRGPGMPTHQGGIPGSDH